MTEETITAESVGQTGSSASNPDPLAAGAQGESGKQTSTNELTNEERKEFDNLKSLVGEQGRKLGDYEKFVENMGPLFEKLDSQPEVIQGILEGKITSDLAKSVLEGKTNVETAQQVSQAHEQVKKEAGATYKSLSTEEVENRIMSKLETMMTQKFSEFQSKVQGRIDTSEEERKFENYNKDFVARTPDFKDYADDMWAWFEENPYQWDMSVAYEVAKGRRLAAANSKKSESATAEEAKNLALNASGGGSQVSGVITDKSIVDQLISNSPNPNYL